MNWLAQKSSQILFAFTTSSATRDAVDTVSHFHLQTYEKAMKFSFNEFHIWYQFALSLMCSQKVRRHRARSRYD